MLALLLASGVLFVFGNDPGRAEDKAAGWRAKLSGELVKRLGDLRRANRLDTLLDVNVRLRVPEEADGRAGTKPSRRKGEIEGGIPGEKVERALPGESRRQAIADVVNSFVDWLRRRGYEVTSVRTRAPVVGVGAAAGKIEEIARRLEVIAVDLDVEMKPM